MNPYDWQAHNPRIEVPRREVGPVAEKLARGKNAVLLAGRGMGKSVFLQQLKATLEQDPEVRVRLISAPPARLTAEACMRALARALGVEIDDPLGTHEVIRAYFDRGGQPPRLVLLYDEFDRYARRAHHEDEPAPGREFFNNLESMRRDVPQVGILATGSLGVFAFRDALGSSFLARADAVRIRPFATAELELLARPFAERGEALKAETLTALELMSGGNPALATYGLEALWPRAAPGERAVAEVFVRFEEENAEFLRDFQLSFAAPSFSEAPQRVWELLQTTREPIPQSELARVLGSPKGRLPLTVADVLDLLQAAGLVRVRGSLRADPAMVRPIASILNLPTASAPSSRLGERLGKDLETLLTRVHAAGADFFRPGVRQSGPEQPGSAAETGKKLVPEAVFAAYLALGFELLGWQVEREAQSAAGRTDLKLRWNGGSEVAIVELKIWGRPGYRDVHDQLLKYWSSEVEAGAVVMLTDVEVADWPAVYQRDCLAGRVSEVELVLSAEGPVRARFRCAARTADGVQASVEHFLLRVPR